MLKGSKLVKDSSIYFGFKIIDMLFPLFLLPIITRKLEPDQYGLYVLYTALTAVLLPLLTLSVDSSILLNYFKLKREDFSNYFSSGYFILLITSIAIGFIVWLFRFPLSDLASFPVELIIILILACFFQFHSNLALNIYQVRQEPVKYGIFSLSLTVVRNALILILLFYFNLDGEGIIYGHLFTNILFFLISIYLFWSLKLFTLSLSKAFILDNIKVGYPLSLHQFGSWLSSSATRIIVGGILGTAAAGSFGVGATIGMIVAFTQDSFNRAFAPYLFNQLQTFNKGVEGKLIKMTYGYNFGLLIFAIVVGVAGYLSVGLLFGSSYEQSKNVVIFLCLAYAFDGMYKMHVNYIFFTKKTHLIFLITLTTGLFNILLSYLFVRNFGIAGGAISLSLINFIGYLLSWYIGNRVFPMEWFSWKAQEHI
jgi:O-antigen/teichoic acid export membrane protein